MKHPISIQAPYILNRKMVMLAHAAKVILCLYWIFRSAALIASEQPDSQLLVYFLPAMQLQGIKIYSLILLYGFLGCWVAASIQTKLCSVFQTTVVVITAVYVALIDEALFLHSFTLITKHVPILMLIGIVFNFESYKSRGSSGGEAPG